MKISERASFWLRWLRITFKSIWSKTAAIIFILSFVLSETLWWRLYGPEKAMEQTIENLIPVFAGAIITVAIIAFIKFFEVRALVMTEENKLRWITEKQTDEAKRISNWLSTHLSNLNIGISEAYLFGSVTHKDYESHDVDVALLFQSMKDKEYIKKERNLTPIANEFNKTFTKRLHFQRFLASEADKFYQFVSLQSEPILILGGSNEQRSTP